MRTIQCPNCLRYRGDMTCDAFADGIPEEIITGAFDHSELFDNEQLVFLPIPGGDLVKAGDHTKRIADQDAAKYERVKGVLKQKGYTEGDFSEKSGVFYGWSVNELLEYLGQMKNE